MGIPTGFSEPIVHAPESASKAYNYRSNKGMVPSQEWIVFFDDFHTTVGTDVPFGWNARVEDTNAVLQVAADGSDTTTGGGVLEQSGDGADDGITVYGERILKLAGKRFFVEARVKVEDADDNSVVIGFSDNANTTNPEDFYGADDDFFAFGTITDADATPKLIYDKDNGGPVTDTPSSTAFDLEDATWVTLAIEYNGASTASTSGMLNCYVDGKLAVQCSTIAQIPDDLVLAPFFTLRLQDDATDLNYIDYFRYVIER